MLEVLKEILKRAAHDLDQVDADYAVIGGIAVGARTILRFTQDVDFAVNVTSDQHAERIASHLLGLGYRLRTEIDHKPTGRMAILRLISPVVPDTKEIADVPLLDLLFHSVGIESETVEQAQPIDFEGLTDLPAARTPYLIAMKVLSESDERLQDRIDLQNLIQAATDADLAEVPPLLDLITQRGFNNEKDLHAVYETFLAKRQGQ